MILAVTGDREETIEQFQSTLSRRLSFPTLIDRQAKAVRDWNIQGLPVTFIVDRSDKVRWQVLGPWDFASQEIREMIENHLAEKV